MPVSMEATLRVADLEDEAAFHKQKARFHQRALRRTKMTLADLLNRLEAVGITRGEADGVWHGPKAGTRTRRP